MPHRLRALPAALVLCVLALTGCTAQPAVDLDAAQAWVAGIPSDPAGAVGSATMLAGPEQDHDDEETGITLDFDAPLTVSHAEVSCFGGSTVTFAMSVTSATESFSGETEVACDERPHDVSVSSAPASGVTSVTVDATTDVPTYLYAAVIGSSAAG